MNHTTSLVAAIVVGAAAAGLLGWKLKRHCTP